MRHLWETYLRSLSGNRGFKRGLSRPLELSFLEERHPIRHLPKTRDRLHMAWGAVGDHLHAALASQKTASVK